MHRHTALTAFGILLALATGIAIGYAMAGDASPTPAAPPIDAANREVAAGKPLEHVPAIEAADDARTQDARAADEAGAPKSASLAELTATIEIPPVPSGNGVISGVVRTASGEPVPGVRIRSLSDYPRNPDYDIDDVNARIREYARGEKWREQAAVRAVTDESGRYELAGLAEDLDYWIEAKAEGWSFQPAWTNKSRRTYRWTAGDTCDWTASPVVRLEVEVLMPDGSIPKAPKVKVQAKDGGAESWNRQVLGPARFEYDLGPGVWLISASGGAVDQYKADAVEVAVTSEETPAPVRLTLKAVPGIHGTVGVPDCYTSPYLQVYLQKGPPAESPTAPPKRGNYVSEKALWPHDGNMFSFTDLESGRYRVMLRFDDKIVAWQDVQLGGELVELSLKVPEPVREEYIVVRGRDSEGKLLDDLSFNMTLRMEHGSAGTGNVNKVRQQDGSYWVPRRKPAPREGQPEVAFWYELIVTSKKYGPATVRYEGTDTHELDVTFAIPARLKVTVTNLENHPSGGRLSWSFLAPGERTSDRFRWPTGRNEEARKSPLEFGPVQPDVYELVLHLNGLELLRQQITLVSGENEFTTTVPELYTLTVSFSSDADAGSFSVARDGTRVGSVGKLNNGKIVMPGLPSGSYELQSRVGVMQVSLPAQLEVAFAPRRYDCFILSIPEGGAIEALGLCDGDKLTAVNGDSVTIDNIGETLVHASLAKESTTWTVTRAGVSLDITFNGKTLQEIASRREGRERLRLKPGFLD